MKRGAAAALWALAFFAASVARAEIGAPYGPPPPPPMPDGFSRELNGATGADASRLVIWRPAKPGATLLVVAQEEPSLASISQPDLLRLARERNMTILFTGEPEKPAISPSAMQKLRETVIELRRVSPLKKAIGSGLGAGADLLRKLAFDKEGAPFDALLLADGAETPPGGRNTPFVIDLYGSNAFWSPAPNSSPIPAKGPNRRSFFIAGAVISSATAGNCSARVNDRAIEPARRALLAALDDFLQGGPPPPASRDAALKPARDLNWPKIPNMPAPPTDARLAPAIDPDGNETSGLRLPDQALPIATFTGWNAGKDSAKGGCAAGAKFPFPISRAAREASGDPRQSLPERYGSRAYFVAALRSVADKLAKERLLLPQDADAYVAEGKKAPF